MKNRTWGLIFAGLIAALLLLWRLLPGGQGQSVGVYQDGALLRTIDLPYAGQIETFTVSGPAGENTIEVSEDGVRVLSADCPDQICVEHGALREGGTPIVCLPNRLSIQWIERDAAVDAVSGGR